MLPTLGQSEPGSNYKEEVLYIPQSSSITEASLSASLMSYTGHSLGGGVLLLSRDTVGVFYIAPPPPTRHFKLGDYGI